MYKMVSMSDDIDDVSGSDGQLTGGHLKCLITLYNIISAYNVFHAMVEVELNLRQLSGDLLKRGRRIISTVVLQTVNAIFDTDFEKYATLL